MSLTPYADDEHKPFILTGGKPAVLLIHGFPGTPAEMRPLAEVLHAAGWTAQGILLPGFGAQIGTLAQRTAQEWIAAVHAALADLAKSHSPVVLMGFSMGGAVALSAAATAPTPPQGLVLLAPFTRLGPGWQQPLWPLVRLIFREMRPFKDADFTDAQVRRNIANFLPEADLDDPSVQADLRRISLPATALDQLRRVGRMARKRASRVHIPILVVQGQQDQVVDAQLTRRLAARMDPRHTRFVEIDGTHQIIQPQDPGWSATVAAVLDFVEIERGWRGLD